MITLNDFKIIKNNQAPERIYKYEYSISGITYSMFTRNGGKEFSCFIDIGKGRDSSNIFSKDCNSEIEGINILNEYINSEEGEKKFNEYGYYTSRPC